jgi:transposase-like protein
MAKRQEAEEQKLVVADAPQRTVEEKFSLVLEAASVPEPEFGEWLRRKGVHAAQLEEWRTQAMAGLTGAAKRSKETTADARQIRELERELARKDKALAEAAVLLVLQKKVQAIWADEDDDTDEKKDK